MAKRQIGLKLDEVLLDQIDRARGKMDRTSWIEAAALASLARLKQAPESQETRSPKPPQMKKALKEIETETSAAELAESRRGLAPKGYTQPPLYERRSRGPGPIQKKR